MTPNESKIDPLLMRELFRFDEKSGHYFYRARPMSFFKSHRGMASWNSKYVGERAFAAYDKEGYSKTFLLGSYHRAHRIIWAHHYGAWPVNQIDHINGVRDDNRIENLRDVSPLENTRNRATQSNNTSGVTGVSWKPANQKWAARIKVNKREILLGLFEDKALAIAARKEAEARLGFHPNHGRGKPVIYGAFA